MLDRNIQAFGSDRPYRREERQSPFLVARASAERDTRFSGRSSARAFEYRSNDRRRRTNVPNLRWCGENQRPTSHIPSQVRVLARETLLPRPPSNMMSARLLLDRETSERDQPEISR